MGATIQIHYYNGYFGHVNMSIVYDDGTREVIGLNRFDYAAMYADEKQNYYIDRANGRVDSGTYQLSDEQTAILKQRVQDSGSYVGRYAPVSDPYDASTYVNCGEGLWLLLKDIYPNYGNLFTPQARAEMRSPVTYSLMDYTSPENRGDYGDYGTVTPGGGFDSGFDGAGAGFADGISDAVGGYFGKAEAVPSASPIVLDLDGGGIQTTAVNPYGAHFDLDANGFAKAVGWVAPGEGILVRDLDNDGVVDDGRELFGDHTLLLNGQVAANGFQALAELDTNADGKVDANDAAFASLRVWRDLTAPCASLH